MQLSALRVGDSIQVRGFKNKHQLRQVVSHIFGAGIVGEGSLATTDGEYVHRINELGLTYLIERRE